MFEALIGLGGAVLGAAIATAGAGWNERANTRRSRVAAHADARRGAVLEYLNRSQDYVEALLAYRYAGNDVEELNRLRQRAEGAWPKLMSGATSTMRVLGPKDLADAAISLGDACSEFGDLVLKWRPSMRKDRDALEATIDEHYESQQDARRRLTEVAITTTSV